MTSHYADMIGNITVTGHIVRIDFLSQTTSPQPQQDTQFQVSHQLIMPLDGFLRSMGIQEQIRAKLIDDGIITVDQKESNTSADAKPKTSKTSRK